MMKLIPFKEVPIGKWFSGYGPDWPKHQKFLKKSENTAMERIDRRLFTANASMMKSIVEAYL